VVPLTVRTAATTVPPRGRAAAEALQMVVEALPTVVQRTRAAMEAPSKTAVPKIQTARKTRTVPQTVEEALLTGAVHSEARKILPKNKVQVPS